MWGRIHNPAAGSGREMSLSYYIAYIALQYVCECVCVCVCVFV